MHSITSAADSHTADMSHRMKVYAAQMGLRVVCIIGIFLVDNLTARVLLALGAAVLPWMAVLLANRGADRSQRTVAAYRPPAQTELPTVAETQEHTPDPDTVVVDAEYTAHRSPRQLPSAGPSPARHP